MDWACPLLRVAPAETQHEPAAASLLRTGACVPDRRSYRSDEQVALREGASCPSRRYPRRRRLMHELADGTARHGADIDFYENPETPARAPAIYMATTCLAGAPPAVSLLASAHKI